MARTTTLAASLLLFLLACDRAEQPAPADVAPPAGETPSAGRTPAPAHTPAVPTADRASELRAALDQLVSGSGEREPGTDSWFSAETAGVVESVSVDTLGHATVSFQDLRPLIPNASSSAGSRMLLDELNATVFGVAGIESVEYRMAGSCDVFWEWLQYGCQTVRRDGTSVSRD